MDVINKDFLFKQYTIVTIVSSYNFIGINAFMQYIINIKQL